MAAAGWRVSPSHHVSISADEVKEIDKGKMANISPRDFGLARSCNHIPVCSPRHVEHTAKSSSYASQALTMALAVVLL